MSIQKTKELIDTGIRGQEGTGDTLYDGGEKLNQNLNSLYNCFGDYRLGKQAGSGNRIMTLHPAGFYQKHTRAYYAGSENPSGNPIEFGSLHDISVTRDGAGDLIVTLPQGNGHAGECIELVNTDGSVGYGTGRELIIRASGSGDSIGNFGNTWTIRRPNFRIVLWVSEASPTGSKWSYKIDSLYGDKSIPYEATITNIAPDDDKQIVLFNKSQYNVVKQIMFVSQRGSNVHQESSETLLMVNNSNNNDSNVYSSEYARLRTTSPGDPADDLLYEVEYKVVGNSVIATVRNISNVAIDVYIKSIDAIGV